MRRSIKRFVRVKNQIGKKIEMLKQTSDIVVINLSLKIRYFYKQLLNQSNKFSKSLNHINNLLQQQHIHPLQMVTKVIVAAKEYQLDEQIKNIMEFFNQADALEKLNANEPLQLTNIDENIWNQLLNLCKVVANKFPTVTKVKTTDAKQVVGNDLADALTGKSNDEINKLYQAAHYLKIKNLRRCIAAVLACRVYIKPSLEDYNKKCVELGIKQKLTNEESRKMKETYPFMN